MPTRPPKHDPEAKPWERQPRESPEAFEAWVVYRDMGEDRTLSNVAEKLNKSRFAASKHSQRWGWTERFRQYSLHVDRLTQAEMVKRQKSVRERHANVASAHIAVLTPIVLELNKLKESDGTLPDTPHVKSLLRLAQLNAAALKQLVEVERVSVGLPSMHVAHGVGPDGESPKGLVEELILGLFTNPPKHLVDDEGGG